MKRYQINLYKSYQNATIYTIHEEGARFSETDNFFKRFKDDPKRITDIQIIKGWVTRIGEKGALERYFKPEGKALAIPVPPPKSDLRLYCYRVNDNILILGNGGLKTSKKVKNSPDVIPHFQLMNSVSFVFELKKEKSEIRIEGGELKGDLAFYIKEKKS